MSGQIEKALSRIEASQSEMRETQRDMKEAINKLVAVEVRQQEDREAMKRFGNRQAEQEKRIRNLEDTQNRQAWLYNIGQSAISRVVMWLLSAATICGFIAYGVSK